MTLRRRVTALITVGLIALIVLGGWLTYRFVRAADASSTIITTTAPAADASRTLDTAYSDAEGFVSAAVLDAALANTATAAPATCGDPQTCYQASLDLATVSLDRIAAAFPDDGEVADAVQASRDAATAWRRADGDQVFVLLELGRTGDAATVSRSEQSRTPDAVNRSMTTPVRRASSPGRWALPGQCCWSFFSQRWDCCIAGYSAPSIHCAGSCAVQPLRKVDIDRSPSMALPNSVALPSMLSRCADNSSPKSMRPPRLGRDSTSKDPSWQRSVRNSRRRVTAGFRD